MIKDPAGCPNVLEAWEALAGQLAGTLVALNGAPGPNEEPIMAGPVQVYHSAGLRQWTVLVWLPRPPGVVALGAVTCRSACPPGPVPLALITHLDMGLLSGPTRLTLAAAARPAGGSAW